MPEKDIAARRFEAADQKRFAALSGDYNPIHLDPLAARRTPAGVLAVHGMHALLWSLDQVAANYQLRTLCGIDADFAQFLGVGEMASLSVIHHSNESCRLELRVCGERVAQYALKFGEVSAAKELAEGASGISYGAERRDPLPLTQADMMKASGEVFLVLADQDAAAMFPRLVGWIGVGRIMSLLSLTRLVGMVSPGLHSIFHRLTLSLVHGGTGSDRLYFSTRPANLRFAVVTMDVAADGVEGTIRASRRQPPQAQPCLAALAHMVSENAFAGHRALVVGGSRGLGEVTAKLLAAGGAEVAITYAMGAIEAEQIVSEIRLAGGKAYAFRYDCLERADKQLKILDVEPSSIYYFATPRIFGRPTPRFSAERFKLFSRMYVEGFQDMVQVLMAHRASKLAAFYPSTVAAEDTSRHMAEYAMAKATGEVLCSRLTHQYGLLDIVIERLPRLPTDQTASMIEQHIASPTEIMAHVVARVEACARLELFRN